MNDRVSRLRQRSLDAAPYMSAERAQIVTEAYESTEGIPTVLRRAYVFKRLMEIKRIYIGEDELIVGERGPEPKATPTFPELCCHTIEDLEVLRSREKTGFEVSDDVLDVYRDRIIPFWKGKTMRETLLSLMSDEWKACYEAGVFTEFMEQRAPGHTTLDDKIYRRGFADFLQDIRQSIEALDFLNDPNALARKQQLEAMAICSEAIIAFAHRHADLARSMAETEPDAARKAELLRIAEVCTRVPAHAPRDFWEALQAYWFVHVGVITELNTWDSFNPGRLDQHLMPFYKKGVDDGSLTRDAALELLECFWVKFNNHPAPPKVGVTLAESGTYTDFANINVGGLKQDGSDGVNDVSFLLLQAIDEMHLLQPSTNIQLSKKSPERFLKRTLEIVRQGWGQPSIFNTDAVIQEMLRHGKSLEDARDGGISGCVETGAFGKEAYVLTGYFNMPKVLELTLNNGVDPRTSCRVGAATGDPREFTGFDQFYAAYEAQIRYLIDVKVRGSNVIDRLYAVNMPSPFLSIIIDDCIKNGQDYNDGGARYNTTYIQGVGLGTVTDSLSSIKHHVFDNKTVSMDQLIEALSRDFAGLERLRQLFLNRTPKYGNDDDKADALLVRAFNTYVQAIEGRANVKKGFYRANILSTTCHAYFGSVLGATPDGRRAAEPVSEGISPAQGADRRGPTAVIRSVAKVDHLKTGGTLLNQKFTPQVLAGEDGLSRLAQLVRAYFTLDGHHIQFNVVSAETLRDAQTNPEKHRDLIVRVAGYSDYFCDLTRALQDEIIARTEHTVF